MMHFTFPQNLKVLQYQEVNNSPKCHENNK